MARKLKSDKFLFTATLLLVCTSVVMSTAPQPHSPWSGSTTRTTSCSSRPPGPSSVCACCRSSCASTTGKYRQPVVIWTGLAVVAIALIAVLFGPRMKGATRWLAVGPMGVQPSELAKIVIIIFTAALLERRMDRIDEVSHRCCRSALSLAASSRSSCCSRISGRR